MKRSIKWFLCLWIAGVLYLSTACADIDITVYPLEITLIHIESENMTSDGNEVKFEVKFTGGYGPYTCIMRLYDQDTTLLGEVPIGPSQTEGFGWITVITRSGEYLIEAAITGADGETVSAFSDWMWIDAAESIVDITEPAPDPGAVDVPAVEDQPALDITQSDDQPAGVPDPLTITQVYIASGNMLPGSTEVRVQTSFTGGVGPYRCTMTLYDSTLFPVGSTDIGPVQTDSFEWPAAVTESGEYLVEATVSGSGEDMHRCTSDWVWIDVTENIVDITEPAPDAGAADVPAIEDQPALDITQSDDQPAGAPDPLRITQVRIASGNMLPGSTEVRVETSFTGGAGPYRCTMTLYDNMLFPVGSTDIGPVQADSFEWSAAVTESGKYLVEATVSDSGEEMHRCTSDWVWIDVTENIIDITEPSPDPGAADVPAAEDQPALDITQPDDQPDSVPAPLEITSIQIASEDTTPDGNTVSFEINIAGGVGPYACIVGMYSADSGYVDGEFLVPGHTDSFHWDKTVTQSGDYRIEATVTDINGGMCFDTSDWFHIHAGTVLDITQPQATATPQANTEDYENYLDITVVPQPLSVTSVHIEKEEETGSGKDVKFEAKLTGGTPPYVCDMQLIDSNGVPVDFAHIGPTSSMGFGWTKTFFQDGTYMVYAVVTDASGEQSSLYSPWLSISVPQKPTEIKARQQAMADTAMDQYRTHKGQTWFEYNNPYLPGEPWCAAFVQECSRIAGVNDCMYSSSAHCTVLAVDYAKNHRFYNTSNQATWNNSSRVQLTSTESYELGHAPDFMPQVGDLILFETGDWNNGPDHIGIVVEVPNDNEVTFVEGNATVRGSGSNRISKIDQRTVSWRNGSSNVYGFCRPAYY